MVEHRPGLGHRFGVTCIDVGIVGQHITGWVCPADPFDIPPASTAVAVSSTATALR